MSMMKDFKAFGPRGNVDFKDPFISLNGKAYASVDEAPVPATKDCPECAETMLAKARKCKYRGSAL